MDPITMSKDHISVVHFYVFFLSLGRDFWIRDESRHLLLSLVLGVASDPFAISAHHSEFV